MELSEAESLLGVSLPERHRQSLNAYIIGDDGHLQVSLYFGDVADAAEAEQIIESVVARR